MNSSQEIGKQTSSLVNSSTGVAGALLQDGHLSSELRNLVSILGGQSGSGISLEQLLSASSSTGRLPTQTKTTPTSTLPTTPSSSAGEGFAGRKRGLSYGSEENPKRRRSNTYTSRQSGDRQPNKGLRHFSQRVCEKVRAKGTTTYNEVADELVKELSESERKSQVPIDQKNIRRRVYDALNVLMAMNIISKEKKEIKWIGLPTNSAQECQHIEEELAQTQQRIQTKRSEVENLLVQILSFKNLMKRNRDRVAALGAPAQNAAIGLPFIIVNTSKKTTIDCSISSDKSEYIFNFDNAFELHNDVDVLKKMGLDCGLHSGAFTSEDLKQAKSMLPKAFGDTLDDIAFAKAFPNLSTQTPTLIATPGGSVNASPSLTSTPTANLSPLLTPLGIPGLQGSPVSNSQIAAALANVKQVTSALQNSPRAISAQLSSSPVANVSSPVRPSLATLQSKVATGSSSPSALVNKFNLRPAKSPTSTVLKQTSPSHSPMSAAKTALHAHCPSQLQMSPLIQSSIPSATSSSTPTASSSPSVATSKSPAPKIVTVSKLPTAEQLTSILQQLQQNGALSKLLSSAPPSTGSERQVANGSLLSTETETPLESANVNGSSASQLSDMNTDQGGLSDKQVS